MSDQLDKPTPFDSPRLTATSRRFFGACRDLILSETPGLIANLFAKIDEMRKDLADKAADDGRYAAYADAMRFVYSRREQIEARFLAELEMGCDQMEAGNLPAPPVADSDLSYADLDPARAAERQESLVLSNLISKAENRYGTQLETLRGWLASRLGVAAGGGPLGPDLICGAFRAALEPLYGLDLSTKLVVYKLFDKQVMDGLEGLYDRCLACARGSEGITPIGERLGRGSRAAVAPATPSRSAAPAAPRTPASGTADPADTLFSMPTFEELRRLLMRRRPKRDRAAAAGRIGTRDLLRILSRLERELVYGVGGRSQSKLLRLRLRNELRLRAEGGEAGNLSSEDEDTLDLVYLLFENLLQENDLDDAVKDLIGRLQIPIARLALKDKGFFDDRQHPARRLINHLAGSALGWVDDGERDSTSIPGRIERVVRRILEDRGQDLNLFANLDAEFMRLLSDERKQTSDSEERARKEFQDRDARLGAETLVHNLLLERLRAWGEVPEVVSSLVNEGLEQVLLSAYREGGTSGESWRRALSILDWLLWSVQPKEADDDRRELLRRIPELLRTLREALDQVSYDRRRLAAAFRELQALHMAALRPADTGTGQGSQQTLPGPPAGVAPHTAGSAPATSPGRADLASGREADRSRPVVQGLRVGTWLELLRDGSPVRVKLAWRGADSGSHLFVDRRGKKVLEISGEELASLFAQGAATVVGEADQPIVDRAIDGLVQRLEML